MNYSKEEKEAIEKLEFFKETGYATFMIKYDVDRTTANGMIKRTIETVLNLIQKQDKIIKHLAAECSICSGRYEYMEIKEIIEHFEKKVVDEDVKD